MKKIIIITLAIVCLALLVGCQMPKESTELTNKDSINTPSAVEPSSEEIEMDTALDEIDQLEQDFDEDLGFEELDNLSFE